ncbi:MAG: PaaI family thioesterase, partial [Sulfurimonas sp.]|nr:PaaI family thioesterase [Sulfurimonas sp.]
MTNNKEELFEDDEDLDIQEYKGKDDVMLKTHESINQDLCGEIEKLDSGFVKLKLVTTHDMIADSQNLIHGGFIFSAADYAAMAAVNEKNVVLVASECQFL